MTLKDRIIDLGALIIVWFMMALDDIIDLFMTVIVTVIACLLFTNFLFRPVQVIGTSMYPTLKDGALGFSGIITKNINGINRFDIVVVHLEDREENLVKRVIGLPGDHIQYVNDTLYINDEIVEENFLDKEYVKSQTSISGSGLFTSEFEYTCKEDEYFCIGDNRLVSQDSRFYGPFTSEEIVSTGVFIWYPFSEFGKAQ